jgi:hypothetical protein
MFYEGATKNEVSFQGVHVPRAARHVASVFLRVGGGDHREDRPGMLAYLLRINAVQTITIIILAAIVLWHLVEHYRSYKL